MSFLLLSYWPAIGIIYLLILAPTCVHILLFKEDERSAIGWLGLVIFSPILGSLLYWIFGINRVQRHAKMVMPDSSKGRLFHTDRLTPDRTLPEAWRRLMKSGLSVDPSLYLPGNTVRLLENGDEAYPAMRDAIDSAQHSVMLCSYIFDYDDAGKKFVEALGRAKERGVAVYVLLDGYLLGHKWRVHRALRKKGVITSRYLPFNPRFVNLRNHRKILSVDGRIAFIGGINIGQSNVLKDSPRSPVRDIHFAISGPVISQIDHAFASDWEFATGQVIALAAPPFDTHGPVQSRVLLEGPDWNYEKLKWTLLSAINNAAETIRILTPYFIPDDIVRRALEGAALRGVAIEIVVPRKSDIFLLNRAMRANFTKYLEYGMGIYRSPAPFDHSKLCLVDNYWCFIGSSNWDARSLALNFEINLECYDESLNVQLSALFDARKADASRVSAQDVQDSFLRRLTDRFVWLFSPYL